MTDKSRNFHTLHNLPFFITLFVGEQQPQKGRKAKSEVNGQSSSLPAVAAYQRHELTLLRMEDLLNHGSGSEAAPLQNLGVSGRVQTAAELCHRMVDFCQRLTTAKRKILEDPDLYPEVCTIAYSVEILEFVYFLHFCVKVNGRIPNGKKLPI